MSRPPLRALFAVVLAGAATFAAVRAKERRRALNPAPPGADGAFAEAHAGDAATAEGMPEAR